MVGRIHFGSNSSPGQDIKCTFITTKNFLPLLGCPCQVLFSPEQSCLPLTFIKHLTSIMVWGCLAASGSDGLHVVEGMMSATKHCDVLEKVMLPSVRDLDPIENLWCKIGQLIAKSKQTTKRKLKRGFRHPSREICILKLSPPTGIGGSFDDISKAHKISRNVRLSEDY